MACIILRPQTQAWKKLFYHHSTYFLFPTLFSHRRTSQLTPLDLGSVVFSWSESRGLHRGPRCLQKARCQGGANLASDCRPFRCAPQSPLDADQPPPSPCSWLLHFPRAGPTASSACLPPSSPSAPPPSSPPPRGSVLWAGLQLSGPQLQAWLTFPPVPAEWDVGRVLLPRGMVQRPENAGGSPGGVLA